MIGDGKSQPESLSVAPTAEAPGTFFFGVLADAASNGDTGTVMVIKEGLKTPTAVEPAGNMIWVAERGAGQAVSISMPK